MIKFLDLKKVNSEFENKFKDVYNDFLNSGKYILDEQVDNFENEFAKYCGVRYCIGVSNGLDALRLIFEAYKILGKIKIGDEVILPANTYIASILAISNAGLKPILVDPVEETFNIDPIEVGKKITPKTKAILGVHLYGQLYDFEMLESIALNKKILLIEDAAQAHGATFFDGRRAGNLSDAAAFSFYPTKNLGALGDAGAVTTNSEELASIVYKLRNYGRVSSYENDYRGFNCRLDEIQAAFLRIKLRYLNKHNQTRQKIAVKYLSSISNEYITLPYCENLNQHVFHLFVIKSKNRNRLKEYLFKNEVESLIHYPLPIHSQKAYKEFKHLNLPITEKLHEEVLSIPLHQALQSREIEKIIFLLSRFE